MSVDGGEVVKLGVAVAWAALLAVGCGECGEAPPQFRHQALYDQLRRHADSFTMRDGDWKEDYSDASFYGPAFYAHAGLTGYNQRYSLWAEAAHQRNLDVARHENLVTGDADELIMATLGAIEFMAATGDLHRSEDLDFVLDNLDFMLQLFGGYIEPGLAPGYAMENYGPSTVNGLISLVFLQHAKLLGGERREHNVEVGRQLAQRIYDRAWDGERYLFSDQRGGLFLYPNVTMIILNARLYQLTAEASYRDQALATYAAIQPLKVAADSGLASPGRYRSPYSAEYMGAQSDDYTTLSSVNYTMLALALLYEITEDLTYLRELDEQLDFIAERLLGRWCLGHVHRLPCQPLCAEAEVCVAAQCEAETCNHGALHHWIDGRLALPGDPEYFCSGCNLQTLYLLWYRQEILAPLTDRAYRD